MKTQTNTNLTSGSKNVLTSLHTAGLANLRKFSADCRAVFGSLKERVTTQLANEFSGVLQARLVRHVVNEASQLVADTAFPALLFPALAEEKVREASTWVSQ